LYQYWHALMHRFTFIYKTVRNISWATAGTILSSFNTPLICPLTYFMPPPMHPITIGTISIPKPGPLSLNSNANCWCFRSFPLYVSSMFFSFGHAMTTTVIFLSSRILEWKIGLLARLCLVEAPRSLLVSACQLLFLLPTFPFTPDITFSRLSYHSANTLGICNFDSFLAQVLPFSLLMPANRLLRPFCLS